MLGSEDEFGAEDEFGDVDEGELLGILTQAEARESECPEGRAPKRRRIEQSMGGDHNAVNGSLLKGTEDTIQSSSTGDDEFDEDIPQKEVEQSPKRPSRYKIHVPKNGEIPENTFYTQVPTGSQSPPHRIRGPQWPKRPPPVPTVKHNYPANRHLDELPNNAQETVPANTVVDSMPAQTQADQENDYKFAKELDNLPSDAFRSSPAPARNQTDAIEISSQQDYRGQWRDQPMTGRLRGPQSNLKQTTLFGTQPTDSASQPQQTQSVRRHNYPLANKQEAPTHHVLDESNLQTWVYPTNLGKIRDYQFNIVSQALFSNLLVALPTGLGKTFIAATVMLNWYRWTKTAQIVFVAPTRPLVSQQVEACFGIAGIPRSDTVLLTGNTPPGVRAEMWNEKRVFFMTPQTFDNDLKTGIADPKRIVLAVVDEAHRATGGYSYVKMISFLRRFNNSFRLLALTATPGSTVEGVQQVIDGLGIARVTIRTEESIDIKQYVHSREVRSEVFENSEEMVLVMDLLTKALRPVLGQLNQYNAYWVKDPMSLTAYGLTMARQTWMRSDAGKKAEMWKKGTINSVFTILASLAHAINLLKYHGIGPFFQKVQAFRYDTSSKAKPRTAILEHESFKKMMSTVESWVRDRNFVGHPKLEFLRELAYNHFLDAGEGRGIGADQISPAATRIMIFAHFRDSAEDIVRVLKQSEPMIRPHVFVGQAASANSEGMGQKEQGAIIAKFKSGVYNTLVATSIGEEGLDIGEIDLIICYDASASPIRMLQRMGRTGRKRAGKIHLLLMNGKEKDSFEKAKDNYEKMQQMIASGTRFNFHDDTSFRILPKSANPQADKRLIEIPPENSQGDPEPPKRARAPKRPKKVFRMPDNAKLGFTTAARLDDGTSTSEHETLPKPPPSPICEPVAPIESVFLTENEEQKLERDYLNINGEEGQTVEPPDMNAHTSLQRMPRPTSRIEHGRATKSFARMMKGIHEKSRLPDEDCKPQISSQEAAEIDAHYTRRRLGPVAASSSASLGGADASPDPDSAEEANDEPYDFDELDDNDSLKDFIDDTPMLKGRQRSSMSSLPSTLSASKISSLINADAGAGDESDDGSMSDGDLPCIDDLIKQRQAPEVHEPHGRRKRRHVVGSDDEDF